MNGGKKRVTKADKIYHWLRTYIDQNQFSDNLKLPSENYLCRKFEVGRETVRTAYKRLEDLLLVKRVRGSGSYINRASALIQNTESSRLSLKIGLILQGQDVGANAGLIKGIRSVIRDKEVDLKIFFTDNKFSNERNCLNVVTYQNFDGFIIDGVKASILNPNLDCYRRIFSRKIPVIFYNNYYKELKYPHVINNDYKSAHKLLELLIKSGHKRIAGIFVYDNYQSNEKFHGYASALQRYGIDVNDDYVKWCVSNEAHAPGFYKEIGRFLKNIPSCTAIVCCNNMILQAVRNYMKQMKKSCPEDYSLVCFDYSNEDWEEAGITCSLNRGYEMGGEVMKRLLEMINNREYQDNKYSYFFEPVIYEGRSIKTIK